MLSPAAGPARAAVCVGGPVHGLTLLLPATTREVYPLVFIPPADDLPAAPRGEAHQYGPRYIQLYGRQLTLQWHEGTPYAPAAVAAALLNKDGAALYDLGWGAGKPEPTGGGSLYYLDPGDAPSWVEVDDVAAPVAWRDAAGVPVAAAVNVTLLDRWVRLAVPSAAMARRSHHRAPSGTLIDKALAQATLTNEALAEWEAAAGRR